MAPVVGLREDAVHVPHQPRQVAFARVQHQVIVVAHQAVGQHLGIEAVHGLADDPQLRGAVRIVLVDGLPPVAAGGDVVDGAGELDAQGARHGPSVQGTDAIFKT
jgi:hypothetical protein